VCSKTIVVRTEQILTSRSDYRTELRNHAERLLPTRNSRRLMPPSALEFTRITKFRARAAPSGGSAPSTNPFAHWICTNQSDQLCLRGIVDSIAQ
jgi:hypothetical protein